MKEFAYEIFEKINNAKTVKERKTLLQEYGAKVPYSLILSLNFDKTLELDLPEGAPPFKRDEDTHPDLFGSTLAQQIRRIAPLFKGSATPVAKIRREHIFIQVLESIPPKEADILISAKDRALESLYPNITEKLVKEFFPNYCRG